MRTRSSPVPSIRGSCCLSSPSLIQWTQNQWGMVVNSHGLIVSYQIRIHMKRKKNQDSWKFFFEIFLKKRKTRILESFSLKSFWYSQIHKKSVFTDRSGHLASPPFPEQWVNRSRGPGCSARMGRAKTTHFGHFEIELSVASELRY